MSTGTPPLTPPIRAELDAALAPRLAALAALAHSDSRIYLPLPYPAPPEALRGNDHRHQHWGQRQRAAGQVRRDVAHLARAAGLIRCAHLTVGLIWAPGDHRRRDEDNLWPTLKACADALARGRADWTGLQLVPDDTPHYVTKLTPQIVPPPLRGLWVLVDPHPAPREANDG